MNEIKNTKGAFTSGAPFAIGCSCLLFGILIFFAWEETYNPEYLDWLRYVLPQPH